MLSTGVYGYPVDRAAPVALAALEEANAPFGLDLRLVLRDTGTLHVFERARRRSGA